MEVVVDHAELFVQLGVIGHPWSCVQLRARTADSSDPSCTKVWFRGSCQNPALKCQYRLFKRESAPQNYNRPANYL